MSQLLLRTNVKIEILPAEARVVRGASGLLEPDSPAPQVIRVRNLVTLSGRNVIRDLLARGVPGTGAGYAPTHFALGTGTTAVSDSDTKLVAEQYRDLFVTRQGQNSKVIWQGYLSEAQGNGFVYAEAGLFDSAIKDQGSMLARTVFVTTVNKTSSVKLILTWEVQTASA